MSKTEIGHRFYPVAEPDIGPTEEAYVLDAVRSGWVSSLGPYIGTFEDAFASYCGSEHGVATSNGTAALHLALAVLGIGPGDEVIVPSLTFVATANAVRYVGALPVFVDIEEETWCMDPRAVARAVSPRTRAIVVVHLYGQPADMEPLLTVARDHNIPVIEDAAEAHGAEYRGQRVGGLGTLGVFSFYGNKLITTGEGGMLVTSDRGLAERARYLRDHAMSKDRRYWHSEVGYNYRMTNVQAAMGLAQLERIDSFLGHKREILNWYRADLGGAITLNPGLPWARSSYWLSCALLPDAAIRDAVMIALRERGVDTRPFFFPLHALPPYVDAPRYGAASTACLVAEDIGARGINLPSSKLSRDDVSHISATLLDVLARIVADARA